MEKSVMHLVSHMPSHIDYPSQLEILFCYMTNASGFICISLACLAFPDTAIPSYGEKSPLVFLCVGLIFRFPSPAHNFIHKKAVTTIQQLPQDLSLSVKMLNKYKQGHKMAEEILRIKAAAEKKKAALRSAPSAIAPNTKKNGKAKQATTKKTKKPSLRKTDSSTSSLSTGSSKSKSNAKQALPRQVSFDKCDVSVASENTFVSAELDSPSVHSLKTPEAATSPVVDKNKCDKENSNALNSSKARGQSHDSMDMDFQDTIAINDIWAGLKQQDGYEDELGEQIFLHMVQADPKVREEIGIVSVRSERFGDVCQVFVELVDVVVTLLGTIEEDELHVLAELCRKGGINPILFGNAVSAGVKSVLKDSTRMPDNMSDLWSTAFEKVFSDVKETMV